jgi:CubicO group peptidase (beta-lactamase class C family)
VGDGSATSQRHDQQRGGGGHSLHPIDRVLRSCKQASLRDVVKAAPVGHALAVEQQFEPSLDRDRLSDTLSALARKYQVPGAQLAIRHGGETVAIEVGELQYGTGRPVTRDAAFLIGSITKTFTATVAMILVADGDLELDAPLGEHLPELGDLGNELTLRQMLSHTGGLAIGPHSEVELLSTSLRRYVLDHCGRQNLVLPPGTGFSYSNMGYVLVGHLIETITGMSWWDALESILLRPLRIEPMFVGAPASRLSGPPLARGHSVNIGTGRTRPVEQSLAAALAPAGGLAVSAVDLVALGLTQVDGGIPALLPAAYAEQMRQAVPGAEPLGSADGWGLGLAVFGHGPTAWVGHFGALDGTMSDVRLDPVSGCVVAFTSNANTGVAMWDGLVDELRRAGILVKDCSDINALRRPTVGPQGCVGSYLNGKTEWLITATDTGALSLAIDGDAVAELIFFEDLNFSARECPSIRGRFLRDPITGHIEKIQVGLHVACRHWTTNKNARYLMGAKAAFV